MPPLAPVITQIVPQYGDPIPMGTRVAMLEMQPGDPDPGPETGFTKTADPGTAYTLIGSFLDAAKELDGAFSVSVTVTTAGGTSPATTDTLIFGDDGNPWNDTDDGYEGNPQIPPVLPAGDKLEAWTLFLVAATNAIVPRARNGVDFVVGRTAKNTAPANTYWNTALLGARPTAEIDAEARRLRDQWPGNVMPI